MEIQRAVELLITGVAVGGAAALVAGFIWFALRGRQGAGARQTTDIKASLVWGVIFPPVVYTAMSVAFFLITGGVGYLITVGAFSLGATLNNIVMYLNGGQMPVCGLHPITAWVHMQTGQLGPGAIHKPAEKGDRLLFLADHIKLKGMSIGDIVAIGGLVTTISYAAVHELL